MEGKWRAKFKFLKGTTAVSRDNRILSEYYKGRTAASCVREWNKNYSTTLTEAEFIEMANDLGWGR